MRKILILWGFVTLAAHAAPLEPARGILTGVNLGDLAPAAFNATTRVDHAFFVVFTGWPPNYNDLDATVAKIAAVQGALVVTPMPWGNPDGISDADITAFAAKMNEYITVRDVPVFVRFAHEMNGSWYPYGGQPVRYTNAFTRVANAIHALGPRAAMVWAVANYQGYPFAYYNKDLAGYLASQYHGTSNDFAAMDTDGNGVLTSADDPYGPYYPGDDVVDWVGSSVYHVDNDYPLSGNNTIPYDRKVTMLLTGFNGSMNNFYTRFAKNKSKPMMLPETSAAYIAAWGGVSDAAVKGGWINQLYHVGATTTAAESLPIRYPWIKAIGWFDVAKFEDHGTGMLWTDWRVSANSVVRTNYHAYLQQVSDNARYCLNAGDVGGFVYGRNGWLNDWQANDARCVVSVTTNALRGCGALQINYAGSTSSIVRAALKTDARYDAPWGQANRVSVWARVPTNAPAIALGLAFESPATNWYERATQPVPADDCWRQLTWAYEPRLVTGATFLTVHLLLTTPTNLAGSLVLDTLAVFPQMTNAPAPPASVTASAGAYVDRVRVAWPASVGADGYQVYRSAQPTSSAATALSPPLSLLLFDDTNVVPGRLYYYWLKASNAFGWSSFSTGTNGYAGSISTGLLNGGFELEGATAGKPADWIWNSTGAGNIWLSGNYAHSGVRSVMFPGWGEWNTLVQTYANGLLGGATVTASVWGLTPGFTMVGAGGALLLRDSDQPTTLYGSTLFITSATPSGQWVKATIVTNLPAQVDSVDFVLQMQGGAAGLVYFDDAALAVPIPETSLLPLGSIIVPGILAALRVKCMQ
ncbi:MAG: hypothetical protein NTV22_06715 [bacterium]|nr:hypothetical protein [bacterium]